MRIIGNKNLSDYNKLLDEKDNKTDQIIKKDDNDAIIRPSSIQKDQ